MTDHLPEQLAARLHSPLPGASAQRQMEPELSYGRHFGPARFDARPAAVVVLLIRRGLQWRLPLMLRPDSMTHHAGQISLPGGSLEPGESTSDAALRELEEELGVPRYAALLLGQLSPIYVFGTNFLVTPCVAAIRSDVPLSPNDAEVAAVLDLPLAHLLNPAHRGQHIQTRGTVSLRAPHFEWQGHFIWGATSMILAELTAAIHDIDDRRPHPSEQSA